MQVWDSIVQGAVQATGIEQAATLLGLVGVWLMIRRSLWAFPVGLIQVVLSAKVFYDYRLYADAKLQGFYFVFLAYGWWYWTRGAGPTVPERPVTRLGSAALLAHVGAGAAGALLWGWLLATRTDAALPYWDATIGAFSIVSQWLQARKKLENWAGWIGVNALAVGVYLAKDLHWFAFLYAVFLLMAVAGWREWRTALPGRKTP
jgi:nicotinamide mononucleotide transporter